MAQATIIDASQQTRKIESEDYPIFKIVPEHKIVRINEVLPFRVKFTTIGIEYSSKHVPPIPLQVIGFSNYIL